MWTDARIPPDVMAGDLRDSTAFTLRSAESVAVAGRILLLASLAFLAGASLWTPDGINPAVVTSVSIATTIVGGLLALWVDRSEIRFDTQRFVRVVGVGPLVRRSERDIGEAKAVVLTWRERLDWSGQPDPIATLAVRLSKGMLDLLNGCRDERIEETAAAISDRLGKPLQVETVPQAPANQRRFTSGLVAVILWGGMLTVSGIVLKPLFSAKPGMPSVLAQPRTANNSPSYNEGVNLFWGGKFAAAEQMFTQATREAPGDPEIMNMLAYAQAEQRKLDQALGTAQEALKAAPGSANIIDTVGEMHERRREYRQAESYYREALKGLNAFESCETHTKLARTLVALHRPSDAIAHLQMALHYPRQPWAETAARLYRSIAPGNPAPRPNGAYMGRFLP